MFLQVGIGIIAFKLKCDNPSTPIPPLPSQRCSTMSCINLLIIINTNNTKPSMIVHNISIDIPLTGDESRVCSCLKTNGKSHNA